MIEFSQKGECTCLKPRRGGEIEWVLVRQCVLGTHE